MIKNYLKFIVIGSLLASCSQDESLTPVQEVNLTATSQEDFELYETEFAVPSGLIHEDFDLITANAVEPTSCAPTPFSTIISELGYAGYDIYGLLYFDLYSQINQLSTFIDQDPQYFGADGEDTNYVVNRTRSLEKFWDMSDLITVRGQHNATLENRDKIADVYLNFSTLTEEEAYANADAFLEINEASTFLIESPLLSFDGFASSSDLIVIGDGLVELASEAGVEDKVVWTGILAHEWAHQIQFDNFDVWYPEGAADNAPEATRFTELEADFFAAFYMTHKRGATYNWKRVADFNELFFNIGDCQFTSPGHHGTPDQRMQAAKAGFDFAQSQRKKGQLLSADHVHWAFLTYLESSIL
ncbi:hypothetical protein DSM03_101577 [Leeuwenhoekiella aestuarii]|uniref:Uncharacterized protein n=1 Tax=Leeuwenhoekiella aestuarii TaxID=2249426 RepID=A0A4Q0NZH9_9FLAO|nr:hypothetical protein [Leeuwenhoekiella aestuarii]RXG17878.1 hypothetical protein DSM04_10162 [Leeuwenhoekiella aestuarii]RXG19207.1 hypothetical protein DSM03_101577 [Leeuwenhoekiella aestuarii]